MVIMVVVVVGTVCSLIEFLNVVFNPRNHILFCPGILKRLGNFCFGAWFYVDELWESLHFVSSPQFILLGTINHQKLDLILPIFIIFAIHLVDYRVPFAYEFFAEVAPFHVKFHDNMSIRQRTGLFIIFEINSIPQIRLWYHKLSKLVVALYLCSLCFQPPLVRLRLRFPNLNHR